MEANQFMAIYSFRVKIIFLLAIVLLSPSKTLCPSSLITGTPVSFQLDCLKIGEN
jgi:hypothetical protein